MKKTKRTRSVEDIINSSFSEVIDTYRKNYKKADRNKDDLKRRKLKEDFYNFKETYPERVVDYFWNYIALGCFDKELLKGAI